MQKIILHIEEPDFTCNGGLSYDQSSHWSAITDVLNKLCRQNKEVCELGRSCWLLPLDTALPELAAAVYHADKAGFPYKILNVNCKEDWISYPKIK